MLSDTYDNLSLSKTAMLRGSTLTGTIAPKGYDADVAWLKQPDSIPDQLKKLLLHQTCNRVQVEKS